jgi:hypothetical protein
MCSRCPAVSKVDSVFVETIVERDTIVELPADSAWYYALLECDSLNNVVVKSETSQQGEKVKIQTIIKDNYIRVQSKVDSSDIAIKWLEKNSSMVRTETITLPPIRIPAELTKAQKFFIKLGKVFLFLIIGIILGFLFKTFVVPKFSITKLLR